MTRLRQAIILSLTLLISWSAVSQELLSFEFLTERSRTYMTSNYGFFMENGVKLYAITYSTPDINGMIDTASGLVVIPVRGENEMLPKLIYQHGTVADRNDAPSLLAGGYQLAELFGGLGFVTIAPDFLGIGVSKGIHPYVHAETQASAAIDMLYALESFAELQEVLLNDQLFITGYSQGGHAAMAVHREIETNLSNEFTVTAAAPLSGPYSISQVMFDLIVGDKPYNFAAYLPHAIRSYDAVYNLFDDVIEEVFNEPYIPALRAFENEEIDLFQLNFQLLQLLEQNTGSTVVRNLMKESFITEIIDDANHPLRQALQDNDVYDWTPSAPTRIFYCEGDDQVPFENSVLADSVMTANGAADLESRNLNSDFDHGQCVTPAITNTIVFFLDYRDISVSTKTISDIESPEIYPNPAQNWFEFSTSKLIRRVEIVDQFGRNILTRTNVTDRMDISRLAPGIYYVRSLFDDGRHGVSKLIKQ